MPNSNFQVGGRENPRKNRNDRFNRSQDEEIVIPEFQNEWITIGANEAMVQYAEAVGNKLTKKGVTNSQFRNIYGEIKRIQSSGWDVNKSAFYLLLPRIAYAIGRAEGRQKEGLKNLKQTMEEAAKYVNSNESYNNYSNLFEAIIAYHKFHGGK